MQCHRLRKEAALAQHKEQEIGKQTRQALLENDALSKTVERLRRNDFGDVRNSVDCGRLLFAFKRTRMSETWLCLECGVSDFDPGSWQSRNLAAR